MPDNNLIFNSIIVQPSLDKVTITNLEILEVIRNSNDLTNEIKDSAANVLDRHSEEGFKSLSDLLSIDFTPEVVDALQGCNELIQLFM